MQRHLFPDLDKCDFTLADVAVDILDGHLSVVFNPALATQDVMDARRHFVPFVVVPKAGGITHILYLISLKIYAHSHKLSAYAAHGDVNPKHRRIQARAAHANRHPHSQRGTYAGSVTCVVPMGTISMDLPQNLFFHRTSKREWMTK